MGGRGASIGKSAGSASAQLSAWQPNVAAADVGLIEYESTGYAGSPESFVITQALREGKQLEPQYQKNSQRLGQSNDTLASSSNFAQKHWQ